MWVETDPAWAARAHILQSYSLNAEALEHSYGLYQAIMFGPSGLSRAEREAVAVCVSAVNDCHY